MTDASDFVLERARTLVGMRVEMVRYYTLPYGNEDRPGWDEQIAHSLDYGLDIVSSGATRGITWSPFEALGYRIDVLDGSVTGTVARGEFATVTDEEPWTSVRGKRISDVELHWFEERSAHRSGRVPSALTIHFEDQRSIALVAAHWLGRDTSMLPTGDDIVVIWDAAAAATLAPYWPHLLSRPTMSDPRPGTPRSTDLRAEARSVLWCEAGRIRSAHG